MAETKEQKAGWYKLRGSDTPMYFSSKPAVKGMEPCDPPAEAKAAEKAADKASK